MSLSTALFTAIRQGDNTSIFIDTEDKKGLTPLILAERGGNAEIVELLRPHRAPSLD